MLVTQFTQLKYAIDETNNCYFCSLYFVFPEPNRPEMGRWSQETGSDNEAHNTGMASPSPNPLPLPNPDLTSDVYHLRHRMKPSILENVHDTYVASVDASRLPLDNRYV